MKVIRAYRMCRQRYDPRDATGSARFGGRWNSPGYPMLYAASTISLACLEILVHLRDPELFPNDFTFTPIEFSERICLSWGVDNFDSRLMEDALESEFISRNIGDGFLLRPKVRELEDEPGEPDVVQTVPSIVVPQEMNYLINPKHPEFNAISWGKQQPFAFDKRLLHVGLR